jgi:hypothetical protein
LELVFQKEVSERVREEALWGLRTILGSKAEPYLLTALEDPSPHIRKEGAWNFMYMPLEVLANALPRLQTMMKKDDPDENVRSTAKTTVNYYDEERA